MSGETGALLALAREAGLALRPEGAALDDSGADFLVLHAVDERGVRWVVRSPRRPDVWARAEPERRALALVGPRLPLAVPEWRVFTERVIAYPRLGGEPAAAVDEAAGGYAWRFDAAAPPPAFLRSLADALAALHGVPAADAAAAGLRVLEPPAVRDAHAARMERAREALEVPEAVWRRWRAWLADESCWPERSALVHGDLHPPHVLIDGAHRVVGLLDWTEAHVGDPAADFAILYATLGGGALDALLERYAAAGGRVWPGMRRHVVETWAAFPAVVAEFARLTGEDAHLHLARVLIEATAAEMEGAGAEDLSVRPLEPGAGARLQPLAEAAREEGFRFLDRLREEYGEGRNRFDAEGEVLLGVFRGGELVAVGGLNRDPHGGLPRTGRVRHLYVLPALRRRGVGRRLLRELVERARPAFDRLVLRTDTERAARFYEALGFSPEEGVPGATHRLDLVGDRAP